MLLSCATLASSLAAVNAIVHLKLVSVVNDLMQELKRIEYLDLEVM